MDRTIEEKVDVLASLCQTLVECVSEIVQSIDDNDTKIAVAAKLGAFALSLEEGDGR